MSGGKRGFWGRMPEAAIFDMRLSAEATRVLMAFASHADRDGRCWPSLELIGQRLGMKVRMLQRYVKLLKDSGYLIRDGSKLTDGGYWVKLYRVLYPDPGEVSKPSPHDVSRNVKTKAKASPDDASGTLKTSCGGAAKTSFRRSETSSSEKKTSPHDVPYIELAHKNSLIRTRSPEPSHFTPRQAASSDDVDAADDDAIDLKSSEGIDEDDCGFQGHDDRER